MTVTLNLTLSEAQIAIAAILAHTTAPKIDPAPAAVIQSIAASVEKATPKPVKAAKPAPTPTAQPTTTATEPAPVQTEPALVSPSSVTLEEVRAKLAALSQAGKTAEVKAIIAAAGAAKLTDIPADKYSEVMEKAAAL
jgi:hypothetical protein